jgi:drug/metabolite transporter (DMT)-like permease
VSRRGWILFLVMSLVWGIPYLLIKVAVDEVSPVLVVFGRCVIGAALLLPWTVATGRLRPALRHWRPLLLFTVLEMAGPWLLLSYAEQSLSSSLTGLLVATVPFVAALAGLLAGRRSDSPPCASWAWVSASSASPCCSVWTSAGPSCCPCSRWP